MTKICNQPLLIYSLQDMEISATELQTILNKIIAKRKHCYSLLFALNTNNVSV